MSRIVLWRQSRRAKIWALAILISYAYVCVIEINICCVLGVEFIHTERLWRIESGRAVVAVDLSSWWKPGRMRGRRCGRKSGIENQGNFDLIRTATELSWIDSLLFSSPITKRSSPLTAAPLTLFRFAPTQSPWSLRFTQFHIRNPMNLSCRLLEFTNINWIWED